MTKTLYTCPNCGSENVLQDAYVNMNTGEEQTFDTKTCADCYRNFDEAIEAEVPNDEAVPLKPLQRHVADHYEGGEFAHINSVEEAATVGDTLFAYAIYEAGDAEDAAELARMLERAIDQLRSVRNELELT